MKELSRAGIVVHGLLKREALYTLSTSNLPRTSESDSWVSVGPREVAVSSRGTVGGSMRVQIVKVVLPACFALCWQATYPEILREVQSQTVENAPGSAAVLPPPTGKGREEDIAFGCHHLFQLQEEECTWGSCQTHQ